MSYEVITMTDGTTYVHITLLAQVKNDNQRFPFLSCNAIAFVLFVANAGVCVHYLYIHFTIPSAAISGATIEES